MAGDKEIVRTRDTPQKIGGFRNWYRDSDMDQDASVTSSDGSTIAGTQKTVSTGHPWPPKKGTSSDVGGDFYTRRSSVTGTLNRIHLQEQRVIKSSSRGTYTRSYRYDGIALPTLPKSSMFPPLIDPSDDEIDSAGTTAIATCKPTNSPVDVSTFLGELVREGLPSLVGSSTWKNRAHAARMAGSEHLNIQFGWLPLVSEISKFANFVSHADTVMSQYERDAGGVVRRQFEFPIENSTVETVIDSAAIAYGGFSSIHHDLLNKGNLVMRRTVSQRKWFSGAFTYYLPSGYYSRSEMERKAILAKDLLGISLTPEVLWNLSPWSWAVDWFTNAGDVISNLTDFATDGLVLRYGYMMVQKTVKDTYTLDRTGLKDRSVTVPPLIFTTEVKTRKRANPFGFGLSGEPFTARRASIVAALGLTQGRR